MLLSPAAGHHTYTVRWHARASTVTKEDGGGGSGQAGGSGKVESEPQTQIQGGGGDGGGKNKSAVWCMDGGEERRMGRVGEFG